MRRGRIEPALRPAPLFGIVLGLVLGIGCQENRAIPPPPDLGQSSIFLAIDGEELAEAFAIEGGDALPHLVFDPDRLQSYYIATYDRSLAAQRIVPGPIVLDAEGREPNPPIHGYTLVLDTSDWMVTDPPRLWSTIRLQSVPVDCDEFGAFARAERQITESATAGRDWVTSSSVRSKVLVGNDAGVWDVEGDKPTPLIERGGDQLMGITGTATAPVQAMFNGGGGGYFVYQKGGKLSQGFLETGFREIGHPPGAGIAKTAWVDGAPFDGYEVYILDSRGGLWRYLLDAEPADHWTTLLQPSDQDFEWRGGLRYIDEEDVMVAGPEGGRIIRFQHGLPQPAPTPEPSHPTVLVRTLALGLVLGDAEGRIWRSVSGNWEKLEAPLMSPVIMIGTFYDGLLYGGDNGVLSYYREGHPECTRGVKTPPTTFGMRALDSGAYVFFSSSGFFGDAGVITLTTLSP